MSQRFDAILKYLPENYPQDWALFAGVNPSSAVTVIDADVSTVTAAADKVLRVEEREPWILHLVHRNLPNGKRYLDFEYDVIRLWRLTPAAILAGGIGTLPLLPLTRVTRPELPNLVRKMEKRFGRGGLRADVDSLWTATYVLMGLEYELAFASQL